MSFQPANLDAQSVPFVRELPLAAGSDLLEGALLLEVAGEFAECGADPALIAAVAVTGGGADTEGFRLPAVREFPPGRMQGIVVEKQRRFSALYIGTLGAVGDDYGVVKDTDGLWKVDFNDAVATRVKLVDIDGAAAPLSLPRVIVEFLEANIQII